MYDSLVVWHLCVDDSLHFAGLIKLKHPSFHSPMTIMAPHFHSSRRSTSYSSQIQSKILEIEMVPVTPTLYCLDLNLILISYLPSSSKIAKKKHTIFIIFSTLQSELSPWILFFQKWPKTQLESLSLELLVTLCLFINQLGSPFSFWFLIFN